MSRGFGPARDLIHSDGRNGKAPWWEPGPSAPLSPHDPDLLGPGPGAVVLVVGTLLNNSAIYKAFGAPEGFAS